MIIEIYGSLMSSLFGGIFCLWLNFRIFMHYCQEKRSSTEVTRAEGQVELAGISIVVSFLIFSYAGGIIYKRVLSWCELANVVVQKSGG
jgi:hypothetical protein